MTTIFTDKKYLDFKYLLFHSLVWKNKEKLEEITKLPNHNGLVKALKIASNYDEVEELEQKIQRLTERMNKRLAYEREAVLSGPVKIFYLPEKIS